MTAVKSLAKKGKFTMLFLFSFLFALMLFTRPEPASQGVSRGLLCCASIIIPALFPFMVLSEFVVRTGLARAMGKIFAPVTRALFSLPGSSGASIFMSFIGGYPVGAKAACELYRRGELTLQEARRMMLFCVNAGPAFVISAVGAGMLGSAATGIVLFASHLAASLCIGIFLGIKAKKPGKSSREEIHTPASLKPVPLSDAFVEATSSAASAMFSICAFVVFFFTLTSLVQESPVTGFLLNSAASLGANREIAALIIPVTLEVTAGCTNIASAEILTIPLLAFCLSWAGLSVHFQVLSAAREIKVPAHTFVFYRFISGFIAMAFSSVIYALLPLDKAVFSSGDSVIPSFFSYSPAASVALLALCAALLLSDKLTRQETP